MNAATWLCAAGLLLAISAAVSVAVLIADRVLPARWVRERHDVAVVAIVTMPIIFWLALQPAPASNAAFNVASPGGTPDVSSAPMPTIESQRLNVEPTQVTSVQPMSFAPLALAIWLIGAVAGLLRTAFALRSLQRLTDASRRDPRYSQLRLSRPIPIRVSNAVPAPLLVGFFRPVILLPNRAAPVPQSVLEHEIAHVVRGDAWIALAVHLSLVFFWWLIPLRVVLPIIHRTREMLADSYAVQVTGEPVALAHALLDSAAATRQTPALALAAAKEGSMLRARVRRLSDALYASPARSWCRLSTVVPIVLVVAWTTTPRLGEAQVIAHDDEAVVIAWTEDDDDSRLTLYSAARHGRLEDVRRLVAAGADPSAVAHGDGTPLMGAIRGAHTDVVDYLLEAGADVNAVAPGDGTALIAAVRTGKSALVTQLLASGAQPNLAVPGDGNPLIVAAHNGYEQIVATLLAEGADPNAASPRDGNPLIAAALMGNVGVTRQLLAAGADPNGYVYRDETPLINAAQQGHLDVLNVLIDAGADVSLTVATPPHDPGGAFRSPLSEAERNGHSHIVKRLKELGAEHAVPADD
ncbi:MAG: ankyrin repeat domain-containing protein [Pseudomonadota bacterium]